MAYATDAARWRALSTRDPASNNAFVYTVKSTQVYCRPTCPARLARRANIGFCETPLEAQRAGFRACKRCRPDLETTEDPQFKAVAKARALIEELVERGEGKEGLRLQDLARNVGLTRRYFHKIFKDRMGVTPREYAIAKMEEKGNAGRGDVEVEEVGVCETGEVRSSDGVVDMGPFSFDQFEFGEFLSFEGGLGQPVMSETMALPDSETLESMPASFDDPVGVNLLAPHLTTVNFDCFDSGLEVYERLGQQNPRASLAESMVVTTATFDLDAAVVLNSTKLADFAHGSYDPVFV